MSLYKYYFALFCITSIVLISCTSHTGEDAQTIMTVKGPIKAAEMDTTLVHEHILVDWIGADSTGYDRWNREAVIDRMLPSLLEAKERGLKTFFDLTPAYLGRDPFLLADLAEQSGLNIITNTGFYGAVENKYMPQIAYESSSDEIASIWIQEYEGGIEDSEVRPGFIKISVGAEQPLSEIHQKIVDSAIQTHLETGLTITSHTGGDIPALEQVEQLKRGGVSPSAWVWTHAQSGTMEGNLEAAGEGAWISLDNVNAGGDDNGNIDWIADRLMKLKEAGFLTQTLISHDAGFYQAGYENGGDIRSYNDIFDFLIPQLKNRGFTDEDIDQLIIKNPQEAYSIRVRVLDQ